MGSEQKPLKIREFLMIVEYLRYTIDTDRQASFN